MPEQGLLSFKYCLFKLQVFSTFTWTQSTPGVQGHFSRIDNHVISPHWSIVSSKPRSIPFLGAASHNSLSLRWKAFVLRLQVRPGQGLQRDVVYLGWPIAPSNMSPNAGGARGFIQWVRLCTWSTNKLGRSNSIFNLWSRVFCCNVEDCTFTFIYSIYDNYSL